MKKEIHIIEVSLPVSDMETEDSGQFKMFNVNNEPNEENGMSVRLCSWDERMEHREFNKFIGRKVRITVETID